MENQVQHFQKCNKCSGINWIKSRADNGYKILAITIPRDACSDCVSKAYEMYKKPSDSYTNIYLQDKVDDQYLTR